MITYENACALRDAEFYQPQIAVGQFWYTSKEHAILVGGLNKTPDDPLYPVATIEIGSGRPLHFSVRAFDDYVYAPTLIEVLQQLHGIYMTDGLNLWQLRNGVLDMVGDAWDVVDLYLQQKAKQ